MNLEQGAGETTLALKLDGVPIGTEEETERNLDTFYIRSLKQIVRAPLISSICFYSLLMHICLFSMPGVSLIFNTAGAHAPAAAAAAAVHIAELELETDRHIYSFHCTSPRPIPIANSKLMVNEEDDSFDARRPRFE